jgi:hypothetical protein
MIYTCGQQLLAIAPHSRLFLAGTSALSPRVVTLPR